MISVPAPLHILIVEDNPGDVRLAEEILKEGSYPFCLHACEDGVDALAYLRREEPYAAAAIPDLIFLDLNLPKIDGKEFLAIIKNDPSLKRIPVIVLTTSEIEQDVADAYDLHASCYIVKPLGLEQFIEVIRSIENFWLKTVKLPGR